MGFSDSKLLRHIDPSQWAIRKLGLNWGNVVTKPWRKFLGRNSVANSAESYQHINNAYGVANDYKLDTRYRSLAELTGTK